MSVREVYEEELLKRGYQSDPAQLRAIEALERCAKEWAAYKSKRSGLLAKFLFTPLVSCPHAVASCAAPVSAAARCPRWPADGGAAPVGSGARGATPPTRARCSCSP